MIKVEHISKTFQVSKRNSGFGEAVKALFHKQYEYVKALEDVSFTIEDGEMVGYIGPNGAGKSSTIKILSGILTPDSGTCEINSRTPWKNRVDHVKDIGVVFGQRSQLWWDVPVLDSFELLRDIYSIPHSKYKDKLEELVTLLKLHEIIKTPTRQLSLGQRMRCEIAASLLHSPKILFLDEPTIGLDAVSKIAVRNFILDMNQTHKTTVILTTHDMQDIEALTKRIILIGKGKILLDGNLSDMKKQVGGCKKLSLDYTDKENERNHRDMVIQGVLALNSKDMNSIDMHSKDMNSNDIHSIDMLNIEDVPNFLDISYIKLCKGMNIISDNCASSKGGLSGTRHAVLELDTEVMNVSDAIGWLAGQVNIKDISVEDSSVDEVVAGLYRQYQI